MHGTLKARVGSWATRALALTLGFVAALLTFLTAATALMLPSDVAQNRHYESVFRQAAMFAAKYREHQGHLPDGDAMRVWAARVEPANSPMQDLHAGPLSDEATSQLGEAPPGGFVLSFWRGEWTEGYASWSGRTTLETSYADFCLSSFGLMLLLFAGMAAGAGWGAWRLWRGMRS